MTADHTESSYLHDGSDFCCGFSNLTTDALTGTPADVNPVKVTTIDRMMRLRSRRYG